MVVSGKVTNFKVICLVMDSNFRSNEYLRFKICPQTSFELWEGQ